MRIVTQLVMYRRHLKYLVLSMLLMSVACSPNIERFPVPDSELNRAAPYGIAGPLRYWGDSLPQGLVDVIVSEQIERLGRQYEKEIATGTTIERNILALSGGGADGAFGAGFMNGWTDRGDRPDFDIVTGISTGSIIALLSFLGIDYDEKLKEFYTTYSTKDLLEETPFAALQGGSSITDVRGYRALIDSFIDDDVVVRLAEASRAGRFLLIGTTNLDATRPVTWSLTTIAATGHPKAKSLIRDIIQASSAIPVVMEPVLIPVQTPDGRQYDEAHVDGGATQQVMLFSPELPIRRIDRALGAKVNRNLYVVMNNALEKPYDPVDLGVLPIAEKALDGVISGSGSGDIYKIYAIAMRDDVAFNVTWVPKSFDRKPKEAFDLEYMRALYELGYSYGLSGANWRRHPPNFVLDE